MSGQSIEEPKTCTCWKTGVVEWIDKTILIYKARIATTQKVLDHAPPNGVAHVTDNLIFYKDRLRDLKKQKEILTGK